MILLAKKKAGEAVALLEEAARGEDDMALDFGLSNPVKPAHELLAETLLSKGRYAEAKAHYELALKRAPGRALSLKGLPRAEEAAAWTDSQ